MKPQFRIEITDEPTLEETEFIVQQLLQYNSHRAGEGNFRQLAIFLRDTDEHLVGGLIGSTYWQWLYIDVFWIHESCRGGGYGISLLAAAEQEAVKRGCQYAYLDTFSFQAPEFYQKFGYVVFGELSNFPEGHSRFFLKKYCNRHSLTTPAHRTSVGGAETVRPNPNCKHPEKHFL